MRLAQSKELLQIEET